MDYPFYVLKLGRLSDDLLRSLQERLGGHPEESYEVAPGFSPAYGLLQPANLELNGLDAELLSQLQGLGLSSQACRQLKFNRMDPGRALLEHSDIDGYDNNDLTMYNCFACHRVHVPIMTNDKVRYLHRRSRDSRTIENRLDLGGVYLYNDYVLHSVFNDGPSTRINCVLKFEDPKHLQKKRFLERAKIKIGEYYELKRPWHQA